MFILCLFYLTAQRLHFIFKRARKIDFFLIMKKKKYHILKR